MFTWPDKLNHNQQQILLAASFLWVPHNQTEIYDAVRRLELKQENGKTFSSALVGDTLQALTTTPWLETNKHSYKTEYFTTEPLRSQLYNKLLVENPPEKLHTTLYSIYNTLPNSRYWYVYELKHIIAITRLLLLTPKAKQDTLKMLKDSAEPYHNWSQIIADAVLFDFSPETSQHFRRDAHSEIMENACWLFNHYWSPELIPACDWAIAQVQLPEHKNHDTVRSLAAELLLHKGQAQAALTLLEGYHDGLAQILRAYQQMQQGNWATAQSLFEQGYKQRQKETGRKTNLLNDSLAWVYPVILLAQGTPKHLELARKFVTAQSSKRQPPPDDIWGQWLHVINIKQGAAEPSIAWLNFLERRKEALYQFWTMLLINWLGLHHLNHLHKPLRNAVGKYIEDLLKICQACQLDGIAWQVSCLQKILHEQAVPANFMMAGSAESWRDLLQALQGLSKPESAQDTPARKTRLLWQLSISKLGQLVAITPLEQKQGVRGWNKPKIISLAKCSELPELTPYDIKLLQHTRPARFSNATLFNLPNAISALVGHPHIVQDDSASQFIELVAAQPEMEVIQKSGKIKLQIRPGLRNKSEDDALYWSNETRPEFEELRLISLVQESSQRVKLYRFTPEQRRALQLLQRDISIPDSARVEVQATIQALSGHFQMQGSEEHIQADREVECTPQLRAELAPVGEGLSLRLVSAPLGLDGPRVTPGSGRPRLMSMINNESVATTRDIKAERKNLKTIIEALPFLDEYDGDDKQATWEVTDAEHALSMVEILPQLDAIAALDWPKGKAVRVIPLNSDQMAIKIKSERDWFRMEGQATVDEGMVFQFETLLAAAQNNSRFVAMGDGVYLALTRRLKEQLADIAALSEQDKQGSKISKLATAWLDDALEGFQVKSDKEYRQSLQKLRDAQQQHFALPKTLQAELRPYQEDGYLWAQRLAAAGFGGCLADDMGLGKTLQSLAILLDRAEGGPALIIAPTSVCGNWMAEANRFAPSLNMHLYSEAERDTLLTQVGPFDVVVVSYNLLQLSEQFATVQWHTVISDEAQAIKNATAKRTQAVYELNADFKLALSGTPVENRLSELWSIMRFANPGLLGTLNRFNERFVTPIERNKDRNALHILRKLIAPFLLRRTKAQVLQELPPRTELLLHITPDARETAHYEALRRAAIAEADMAIASGKAGQARLNILAQLTKLRRAACDPRIVTDSYGEAGGKVQSFITLATELVANGHKTLVFSQFVDFLSILSKALDEAGLSYQYLDGATPAAERTKRVNNFQAGHSDLFLISLKAGGFGLNLTAADYVVITDPWWNPAAEDQAMGRAHRMGQQRPVTVYRLVTKGTVEEHIVGLHSDKRALAESILGEGDAVATPSTDELMALIKGDI